MKIFYVVALLTFLSISSFSQSNNAFLGTWIIQNVDRQNCQDKSFAGIVKLGCDDSTCYKIEFTQDGKMAMTSIENGEQSIQSGTYATTSNSIKFCLTSNGENDCDTIECRIDGTNLVLISRGEADSGCDVIATYTRA